MCRPLQLLGCLLTAAAPHLAAAFLPPVRGSISGELHVFEEAIAPIPWTLTAAPGAGRGGARLILTATPPDARLRVFIEPASPGREGSWRIEEGSLDVAAWWPRLAPHLAPRLASLAAEGTLNLVGGGAWTDEGPVGAVQLEWASEGLSIPDPAVAVEQLRLVVEITGGWSDRSLTGHGRLEFDRATFGEAIASQGEVTLAAESLAPEMEVTIGPARFSAFGGEVVVAPVSWRPGGDDFVLRMRLTGAELSQLVAFTPAAVREAQGRVSGEMLLGWTPEGGLVPLGGDLRVAEGESVRLRLAPQPGFLTQRVPRRLQLLPDWAGAIGRRWFSPVNPAFEILEAIELGRESLVVEGLVVELFSPDDPLNRTARVRLEGHPEDASVVEQVTIEINLSGPLTELLQLGFDERVQIEPPE